MPSTIRFIGPPKTGAGVPGMVAKAMQDPAYDSAWMITAITDDHGLESIAKGLRDLRFRGGSTEAILTTVPGGSGGDNLHSAIKLIDEPYAFLEPAPHLIGTFYYVAQNDRAASVVVGPAGFVPKPGGRKGHPDARVHESAFAFELDLSKKQDAGMLAEIRTHYERLRDLYPACRRLTSDLVPDLVAAADEPLSPLRKRRASGEKTGVQGFFKRLSNNDVSWKDSPGQIIIPKGFVSFFDELTYGRDLSNQGGPRQRHTELPLSFRDGKYRAEVHGARVVLYVPAENHPRKNPEMRFNFRNNEILGRLAAGDFLLFRRDGQDHVVVERKGPDWIPPGESEPKRSGPLE